MSTPKLPHASEAATRTMTIIAQRNESQLIDVDRQIRAAISKNEFSIMVQGLAGWLSSELTELGYSVYQSRDPKDVDLWYVEWRHVI